MTDRSRTLTILIRTLLAAGAAGLLPMAGALAQDPDQPVPPTPAPGAAEIGKIEVTGTRIKRTDVEAARPITIVTRAQIKASGLTSIGDVLQTLPSAGAAVNSRFNNGNTGRTNADLRNLGPNRLLVLLDGRRVTGGLHGDVDLNTLPLAIVDHIEILQDGASAIYGSDALSGVINIITVKDYDKAEANASLGIYDAKADGGSWDGKTQQYDFTLGGSGGKGSVLLDVSYAQQAPVYAGNRSISKEPVIGSGHLAGSSFTPRGSFILVTPSLTCPGSATAAFSASSSGTCDMTLIHPSRHPSLANFRNFEPKDRFNYAPENFLETPSERTGIFTQGHYDLRDNLSFDAQFMFSHRESSQQLAPAAVGIGAFGQAQVSGVPISISGKNPYNPFGVDLVSDLSNPCFTAGNCDLLLRIGRRLSEAGNRTFTQKVDDYEFNTGLHGFVEAGSREWDWDVNYGFASNYESDNDAGVLNTQRMQDELGLPGQVPCAGAGADCVPLNLFGGQGSITPKMLQYMLFEQHDVLSTNMRDYTANATGDLMDLPAGPLSAAFGLESLETDGYSHPDALVTLGNTGGDAIPFTEGREKTFAQYLEFNIPLVADRPFMKNVSVDIANRWSQFQWNGGQAGTGNLSQHTDHASTGNVLLRWQTDDELLLRASWAQGFRIPSIDDLYLADSHSADFVVDPCVIGPFNPSVAPFCGTGPYQQLDPFNPTVPITVGGNTRLTPERSISQTVGFVYNPDWLRGFDVSMDYYKINLENAIGQVPTGLIVDGCYQSGLQQYCDLIRRSGGNHSAVAPGQITDVQNLNANIGGIKVEGVDLSMHYSFPYTSVGDFKASLDWSFTKQYVTTLAFGSGLSSQELSGTTTDGSGAAGTGQVTGGIPKQRATVDLNWNRGDWSASWSVQYFSALIEDCTAAQVVNPPSRCPLTINFPFESKAVAGNHIGATFYHDVQGTYHMDSLGTDFSLGVRNLFDKQPPIAMSAFANSFLPSFYRTPGRFYFAGASVNF